MFRFLVLVTVKYILTFSALIRFAGWTNLNNHSFLWTQIKIPKTFKVFNYAFYKTLFLIQLDFFLFWLISKNTPDWKCIITLCFTFSTILHQCTFSKTQAHTCYVLRFFSCLKESFESDQPNGSLQEPSFERKFLSQNFFSFRNFLLSFPTNKLRYCIASLCNVIM